MARQVGVVSVSLRAPTAQNRLSMRERYGKG
jgi:hypothetical protein